MSDSMHLTGAELLVILQSMSPDQLAMRVSMEGCDCDGDACSVSVDTDGIYLRRGLSGEYVPVRYLEIRERQAAEAAEAARRHRERIEAKLAPYKDMLP